MRGGARGVMRHGGTPPPLHALSAVFGASASRGFAVAGHCCCVPCMYDGPARRRRASCCCCCCHMHMVVVVFNAAQNEHARVR